MRQGLIGALVVLAVGIALPYWILIYGVAFAIAVANQARFLAEGRQAAPDRPPRDPQYGMFIFAAALNAAGMAFIPMLILVLTGRIETGTL